MRKGMIGTGLAALVLAGCQAAPEAEVAANKAEANVTGNSEAGSNVAATVLGYSDKVRNGVLARALIDAKIPCGTVTKSERTRDINNNPAWRAECKNGVFPIVSITPDGTAVVVGAPNP